MDAFNFCWMTLSTESKKCGVFFDKNTCKVKNDVCENFDKPVNRISYLYKYGSYNISLFHQCLMEFYTKVSDSSKIIDNLRSTTNLTVCSMSAGPGTDIVGLLYSLFMINKPLVNRAIFKVISRQGSWRNLVNEMVNSSIISVPAESTCKLIECDFLKDLSKKAQGSLKATDILLMCNSFSSATPGKVISDTLKKVIQELKSGALVFFIISNDKSAHLNELKTFGSFLHGPVKVSLGNMPYNEKIADLVGVKPLCSGTSVFAVWQKTQIEPEVNKSGNSLAALGNKQHSPIKQIKNERDVNSQIPNISTLKREFSSDSLGSTSWFSSSSISSPILNKKDKPVASDQDSVKNISVASLNPMVDNPSCESGFKNKGNNMNSLLRNFENLIAKFEEFVGSQDALKNCHVQGKQSHCCQNMHQGRSKHPVNICHFNDTCCSHSMSCCNHSCPTSVTTSYSHRNLPQDGPCIVIPLQNFSNESLGHILSLVQQNNCSVNLNTLPKEEKS